MSKEVEYEVNLGGDNPWDLEVISNKSQSLERPVPVIEEEVVDKTTVETEKTTEGEETEKAEVEVVEEVEEVSKGVVVKTEEEEDEDTPIDTEFIHALGKKLQKDGLISSEVEFSEEDVTLGNIYNEYVNQNKTKLREEVLVDVQKELKTLGVTQDNMYKLNAFENGVSYDELSKVTKYENFSNLKEADEETMINSIKEMYSARDWSKSEIEDRIDSLEASDNIEKEWDKTKVFFGEIVTNFKTRQSELRQKELVNKQAAEQHNQNIFNTAITSGKIKDEILSPSEREEFNRAIVDKTLTVESNGEKVPLSEFEAFYYSFVNSFEEQLYQFKIHKFRGKELGKLKAQAKDEADDDLSNFLKNKKKSEAQKRSIKKDGSTKNNSKNHYEFVVN